MSILAKTMFAVRDAIIAQAFTWPAAIRADISRGALDDDADARPASTPLPCVLVMASNAEQLHPELGNCNVQLAIEVRHQADGTEPTTHLTQSGELIDFVLGDAFQGAVNAYTGFTMFGRGAASQTFDRVGRKWATRIELNLSAAPGDIS